MQKKGAKVEFYKGRGIDFDDTPTIKKFNEVEESGVDLYEYLYAYVSVKDMESDKNASGETIRGSLKRKQISCMVNQLGIPAKQQTKSMISCTEISKSKGVKSLCNLKLKRIKSQDWTRNC